VARLAVVPFLAVARLAVDRFAVFGADLAAGFFAVFVFAVVFFVFAAAMG
jgi:hypothetical protein